MILTINGYKIINGWWNVYENQKEYIEWLGKELGYTTMEDWYKIISED